MAAYSLHVDEGNGRAYMTTVYADDAQAAIGALVGRVAREAETASLEILEVLEVLGAEVPDAEG